MSLLQAALKLTGFSSVTSTYDHFSLKQYDTDNTVLFFLAEQQNFQNMFELFSDAIKVKSFFWF